MTTDTTNARPASEPAADPLDLDVLTLAERLGCDPDTVRYWLRRHTLHP